MEQVGPAVIAVGYAAVRILTKVIHILADGLRDATDVTAQSWQSGSRMRNLRTIDITLRHLCGLPYCVRYPRIKAVAEITVQALFPADNTEGVIPTESLFQFRQGWIMNHGYFTFLLRDFG